MNDLARHIDALDLDLFTYLQAEGSESDRRALLGLHAAAADTYGSFAYMEIGSYLGGSLQTLMRDGRCTDVISIDPRTVTTPDDRGEPWVYDANTTNHMLELLAGLPDVDMTKLTTLEAGTDALDASNLPLRPNYCFVDGEHTHEAVVRDARFCAEALGGEGIIAFHDYVIVGPAISAFVRENWREISFAIAFGGPSHPSLGGGVFALELGKGGLLRHPAITRAIGSRWHSSIWRAVNRPRNTAKPLLIAWAAMPAIDIFVVHARHGLRHYVR
jgi:hypothetical protein